VVQNSKSKTYQSDVGDEWLLYSKDKGRYYYSFFGKELPPEMIEKKNCLSPKINISIQAPVDDNPEKITFTHGILGYTMKLERLND